MTSTFTHPFSFPRNILLVFLLGAPFVSLSVASDGVSETDALARAAQNPVANMISLPFQNNTDFNFGPREKTLSTTNIQPVVPFELNDEWNVITRTIIPIVSQPGISPGQDRETGLGDTTFTAFLSPKDSGKWIWAQDRSL